MENQTLSSITADQIPLPLRGINHATVFVIEDTDRSKTCESFNLLAYHFRSSGFYQTTEPWHWEIESGFADHDRLRDWFVKSENSLRRWASDVLKAISVDSGHLKPTHLWMPTLFGSLASLDWESSLSTHNRQLTSRLPIARPVGIELTNGQLKNVYVGPIDYRLVEALMEKSFGQPDHTWTKEPRQNGVMFCRPNTPSDTQESQVTVETFADSAGQADTNQIFENQIQELTGLRWMTVGANQLGTSLIAHRFILVGNLAWAFDRPVIEFEIADRKRLFLEVPQLATWLKRANVQSIDIYHCCTTDTEPTPADLQNLRLFCDSLSQRLDCSIRFGWSTTGGSRVTALGIYQAISPFSESNQGFSTMVGAEEHSVIDRKFRAVTGPLKEMAIRYSSDDLEKFFQDNPPESQEVDQGAVHRGREKAYEMLQQWQSHFPSVELGQLDDLITKKKNLNQSTNKKRRGKNEGLNP